MSKRTEIIMSGHGGQGVVLAGLILGKAAVFDGKNVLQTQTYGAEARGSLARSEVIISDSKIGFPKIRKCDILVAFNKESLEKYLQYLKEDGILIVDSSIEKIPEIKEKMFKIPAIKTAKKAFGESIYANMVMLGALMKIAKIVSEEAMKKSIKENVAEKTEKTNLNALKKGLKLCKSFAASIV